ncbi:MAG: hypothetical protein H6730_23165 [Deltaproteobacteria bacterium]|nr:hypothetical protein [Deltaproteobacteria bacterium]
MARGGAGEGTVTATGISCGTDCEESYADGAVVSLVAEPGTGSAFGAWTGCDSTSGTTCTVTMTEDRTVSVTFLVGGEATLTVAKDGSGAGSIAGTGIDCGTDCQEAVAIGTTLTLEATPAAGSSFGAWTGCDTTAARSCTVTVTANRTVTATFEAVSAIIISEDITVATTWPAGGVYQVTNSINISAPLTIEAGVVVKLDPGVSLRVTGSLDVDGGTADTPVVFTSSEPSPAGGDWGGIWLTGAGSTFKYCAIQYAGADDRPALWLDEVSASVTNCLFTDHLTPTDSIDGPAALEAADATAGTVIEDNTFYGNRVPLRVNTTFSILANTFSGPAANPRLNKYNGVFVAGCKHLTGNILWPAQAVPYVIGDSNSACNYVTVDATGQLEVGSATAPAVVKLFSEGNLDIFGVLLAHATFTSIRDDELGDTNGDGTSSVPAGGDWSGIRLHTNGSVLEGARLLYGGGNDSPMLEIFGDRSARVVDSVFAYGVPSTQTITTPPALEASEAAAATIIQGNRFYGNVVPLSVSAKFTLDDSNTFTDEAGTVANHFQAVVMGGCGRVTTDIQWALTRVPIVIGDPNSACNYVTVEAAGHLTLANGVIVKFFNSGTLDVYGILTAQASQQIAFTAFADDSLGGDSNADGASSAPAAGDWSGIRLHRSGSNLDRALITYAGGAQSGDDASALRLFDGATASITRCTFAHIQGVDASIQGPAAVDISEGGTAGLVFTENRIFDANRPLLINAHQSLDDSNLFDSGVAAAPLPSRYDAVFVEGCGHINASTQWAVTQVPMVVGDPVTACNYLAVDGGGHLTLGPDLTLKFFAEGNINVYVNAAFTVGAGAWLTTIRDDHGGDTNGDGNDTSPSVGDWYGVKYHHTNADPTCDEGSYMHYQTPNVGVECGW